MSLPAPEPPRRTGGGQTLVIWAVALGVIVAHSQLGPLLQRLHVNTTVFTVLSFFAWLIVIAITLYWITIAIRWLLRRLFWRVGRRLLLSYVLIGGLPFVLMFVLLLVVSYMIAGVMSHAALRGERQATLGQMESWALEYGLTGRKPADALPSLEIYDTGTGDAEKLPEWLRTSTFSGMARRGGTPLLVASRQFPPAPGAPPRTVVFVQPIDNHWAEQLEDKGGMIISFEQAGENARRARVQVGRSEEEYDVQTDKAFERIMSRGLAINRVIWADFTALNEWSSGEMNRRQQLVTFISTPIRNLFQFYFGPSSGQYLLVLQNVVFGLVVMLMMIYMFAALFAAVLIFSISRAVNRIEKGTKAVERGDFTYRIRMKPHNQLGEMAQSFDRMTESIGSLLASVAEKERLQSEIEIAATIQRNLLPKDGPHVRGVSFSAHFEPTASIGGDYYDLFNLDKSRLAVAIGDVSGHGLSTGLVMAMVKAAMTTLVEEGADEASLFERLNELVHRSTERRAFMTLGFTIFDLENGGIRHTNAGHLYPYLLREGTPEPLSIECPSLPLGVRPHISTPTAELDLREGDCVVYLSDGIVEAQSESGDPFGFDQLERLLAEQSDRSPATIRDAILRAVAEHSGSRPADDDRTVMVLRFEQFRTSLAGMPVEQSSAAVIS